MSRGSVSFAENAPSLADVPVFACEGSVAAVSAVSFRAPSGSANGQVTETDAVAFASGGTAGAGAAEPTPVNAPFTAESRPMAVSAEIVRVRGRTRSGIGFPGCVRKRRGGRGGGGGADQGAPG